MFVGNIRLDLLSVLMISVFFGFFLGKILVYRGMKFEVYVSFFCFYLYIIYKKRICVCIMRVVLKGRWKKFKMVIDIWKLKDFI